MYYTPSQLFIGLFLLFRCTTVRGLNCPHSFAEQKDRASNCTSENLYHCLYNEYGKVVEICKHPIWVPAGNCPEYNIGASKLNYAVCQSDRGQCPPASFLSNELFKYSACVPFQRITETTPYPIFSSTQHDITDKNRTDDKNRTEKTSSTAYTIVLSVVVPVALAFGIALAICLKKIHGLQKVKQKAGDQTVLEYLVSSNEQRQDNTHKNNIRINANQKHENEETAVALNSHDETRGASDPKDTNAEKYPLFPKLHKLADEFKSKRAVIVIGTWGSGKSTLANQIKEHVQQDPKLANAESIGLGNLNNWQMTVPEDRVSIVQLKDCVKNWYSEDYISTIRRDFENLISQRPLCYFIILMRWPEWIRLNIEDSKIPYFHAQTIFEDKYEILIEWSLAKNPIFLKITAKQNPSDVEKLYNYLSEYGFNRNLGIGFPGVVNLICRNDRLQSVARFAVKEPVQALYDDLKRLRDSKKPYNVCHFIILVYTMLCGGKCNLNFVNADLLLKVRKLYPCGNEDPIKIFCENPCEEYLDIKSGQHIYLSLVHDVVARVLFKVVSSNNMDLLIEECDADLLLDCIVVYGYKNLKEHQRLNFAKRLQLIELEKGTMDIKHHVFLQEKDFAKAFHTVSEISADE